MNKDIEVILNILDKQQRNIEEVNQSIKLITEILRSQTNNLNGLFEIIDKTK